MVETINAVCPGCKKTFAVPAEYENKKVKCKCGQVFIAAKKLTEPKEPVSIESARGKPSQNKSVIVLGVIVSLTLILSVFLMWLFAFRDKWENENSPKIRQTSDLVISLIQSGKLEQGIAKYEELQTFVKNRRIRSLELRKVLSNAQKAFGEAKCRLEEADKLVKLQTLESKAQSFIENGDLQNGIAKYQEALDFIQKNQTNNPKFTEDMGRISQAKTFATENLSHKQQAETEYRKRIEEDKKLARIKANVKGGAWITKKAGNSETVRGLKIFAVKSMAKNEHLIAMLHATLKGDQERLTLAQNQVAKLKQLERELKQKMDNTKDPEVLEKGIDLLIKLFSGENAAQKLVDNLELILKRTQELTKDASKANASVPVDLKFIFSVVSENAEEEENATWNSICSQLLVGQTHTDVDGKYSIELPGGEYYLYAMFDSSYSRVDWLVPIRVGETKDISVDLHNENAFRITNKNE